MRSTVSVEIVDVRSYEAERVTYDLSVEGLHTYHVLAGDAPVLVHNDNGGDACSVGPNTSDSPAWPNFRKTKTASESGGNYYLSGWSSRKPKVFTQVDIGDVAAARQQMGMPVRTHGLDNGTPGQYFNSHAEKQAEVANPGSDIAVSRPMCDDCLDFFSRKAAYDNQEKRVLDPKGMNIFLPSGARRLKPHGGG